MELYEIVRITKNPIITENVPSGIISVITATMNKDLAERMVTIYQQNANEDESYQIRTLRELEAQPFDYLPTAYECCLLCESYNKCKDVALNQPNNSIRCINFGALKKRVQSI